MIKNRSSKALAVLLVVVMLAGIFPLRAHADFHYDENATDSDYYKLISERSWQLAPGIEEKEVVINNQQGTRRQVVHSVNVDLEHYDNDVIPGYKGMNPTLGNFGIEVTSQQALNAEKLGYGNVVAATNAMLSWYTSDYYKQHPEYVGQPLGWNMCNGYYYENSQGRLGDMSPSYAALVINYDEHPITGEPRPDDIPKVQMRGIADPMTGWEKNAISAWAWLVKPDANGNPVNQFSKDYGGGVASRTFIGVRADGTFVVSVSDGEQAPYSTGFTMYEMAEYMIRMGCVYACNCDGGGSTTFCTQRPGEDLKVNCSLSDGGERPTTNTILIISNPPADGVFANATISSDYDYYTPGSTVTFDALGTDAVGTKVDIPADVEWTVKEDGMGTIANGVFTSNGTEGEVTAQMKYNGKVVGEKKIHIATPDAIALDQPVVTIPFGKTASIPIKATVNNGLHEIGLGPNDVTFTTDNAALGSFNGLQFAAVDEASAPANLTSNVTAKLNMGSHPTLSFQLNLGRGSAVLFDFEGGQADIDVWNVIDNRKGTVWDYDMALSLADKTNGQVHDGEHAMRMELNGLSSNLSHSSEYGWIRLGVDGDAIQLENARSLGFWLYIPDDCIQLWVQGNYMADSDGDGTYDTQCLISMPPAFPNQVYEKVDESGWYYVEMDLSQYEKVALKDTMQFPKDASGEKGDFFLSFIFARAKNNPILDGGTVIGPYTFYLDNITVDYSEAVDDREKPEFDKIYMDGTALVKHEVGTTASSTLTFTSNVADATEKVDANKVSHPLTNTSGINASTAKVFIDGVEVPASYANGVMTAANVKVADGYHRVKFEITDNAGNTAVMIRVFKVESGSGASTVKLVPADPTLDRVLFGSVYWMNLVATDIEKVQSVETVIDMNSVNHWQLDHMVLAKGFTADYTIDEETNTAAITFTRTGDNDLTGEAVLAQIPVRILDYDNDIHVPGKTAAQYWATHEFWGHDLKLDVDKGVITFADGTTGTFSNEEFSVSTEMYTSRNYMDATYLTTHGCTHIHDAAAIEDKAPTCTEDGYTGRTFCEGCNSVVDWGTTVPATGHKFVISGDKLVCETCGMEATVSGLQMIDGKNYYAAGGKLISGWVTVDDEWYYFDPATFEGVDGKSKADGSVEFVFEQGRLTHGAWQQVGNNLRYWYGPGYYKDTAPTTTSSRPYEIDGKTYLFNRYGYMQTGIKHFFNGNVSVYYDCGTDGVAKLLNGPYNDRFYEDGLPVDTYKLCEYEGDYYYVGDGRKIVKSTTVYLNKVLEGVTYADGTPMLKGYYDFDDEGKMILKEGPIDDFFYLHGIKQLAYQLVEYSGDFYYISDGNKIAKNVTVYLNKALEGHTYPDGTPLQKGNYDFDADGKMVLRNGPVGDYFYENGVKVNTYKLCEYKGDYYYVGDGRKLARNVTLYLNKALEGHTYSDGTPMRAGNYEFDADGKMILKNGPVGDFFYINGVKQLAYKLVEYNGDFYYISDGHKLAKNVTVYLNKALEGHTYPDGTPLQKGNYDFDADGKMQLKNGPVGDYFYENGVKVNTYKLCEYKGDFYYVGDGRKIVRNATVYLNKALEGFTYADGTPMLKGYYDFDADGKMILKH